MSHPSWKFCKFSSEKNLDMLKLMQGLKLRYLSSNLPSEPFYTLFDEKTFNGYWEITLLVGHLYYSRDTTRPRRPFSGNKIMDKVSRDVQIWCGTMQMHSTSRVWCICCRVGNGDVERFGVWSSYCYGHHMARQSLKWQRVRTWGGHQAPI